MRSHHCEYCDNLNDLIIGTHGRSLWIMDDISPLQQLSGNGDSKGFHLLEQKPSTLWHNISRGGQRGHFWFAGENPATIDNINSNPRAGFNNQVALSFIVNDPIIDSLVVVISDRAGLHDKELKVGVIQGVNRIYWDREFESQAFTKVQKDDIHELFKNIMANNSASSIKRMYRAFSTAKTPYSQRKALEPLTKSYLSYALPEEYGLPMANEGIYNVTIIHNGNRQSTTITIRDDPMNEN